MAQKKISHPEQAYLAIVRAAEHLQWRHEQFFKEARLTQTQYNVLRILRGAGKEGLPCREIGSRLLTRVPDVTRLLDRIEAGGLIERHRPPENRRTVIARLTPKGKSMADGLDAPLRKLQAELMEGVSERQLISLAKTLNGLATQAAEPS